MKQPLRITVYEDERSLVVVAKCTRCDLAASRLLGEADGLNLAAVVGAEALAALGCAHVEAITLSRRKTMG